MSTARILIVADEPDLIGVLTIRLRAAGYEVHAAGDGPTAIAVALVAHPDLVVIDVDLPAGDGLMVMERLHQLTGDAPIPVIYLTSSTRAADHRQARGHGAVQGFVKPFEAAELLAAVAAAAAITRSTVVATA